MGLCGRWPLGISGGWKPLKRTSDNKGEIVIYLAKLAEFPASNARGNQRDEITMALFLSLGWHVLESMCYLQWDLASETSKPLLGLNTQLFFPSLVMTLSSHRFPFFSNTITYLSFWQPLPFEFWLGKKFRHYITLTPNKSTFHSPYSHTSSLFTSSVTFPDCYYK